MKLLNKKIPLNLGNCKAFIPKYINIVEKPRLNKNINLIEQMKYMSKDNSQSGTINYPSKEELSKLINAGNNINNIQNYFKQNEIIFNNEDKINIKLIYNFYQTTEEYLREANNTYIDYKKSKNYLLKKNPLKNKEQSPTMNLTENNDNKKELNNSTIPNNNTCNIYSKDYNNFNINNPTSQKYYNIAVNPVNSK